MKEDWDALGKLLKQEKPSNIDFFGRTALHYAACKEWSQSEKIRALLKGLGDTDAVDFYGMTALHIAAETGNVHAVQKLISIRADTTIKTPGGRTALHLAVLGCHDVVASRLLEIKGSDITDASKRTALHLAVLSKRVEILLRQERERKEREERQEEKRAEGERRREKSHEMGIRTHRKVQGEN